MEDKEKTQRADDAEVKESKSGFALQSLSTRLLKNKHYPAAQAIYSRAKQWIALAAEKRKKHQQNAATEPQPKKRDSDLPQVFSSEQLIHVFNILGTIGGSFAGILGITKHWELLLLVAFITVVFFLLALFLKLHHPSRWRWFTASVILAALACYGIYHIILKDASPSNPTSQSIGIANPPERTIPVITPSLLPTQAALLPQKRITKLTTSSTPEPEPTMHPDVASRGQITGSVYDAETGNLIQGAEIIAKNDKTGLEYKAASSKNGGFSVTVEAGSYSVSISRDGYIKVTEYCKTSYGSQCGPVVGLQKTPK